MHKKVVIFGGGTGLSSLLKELKEFPIDITAVITVSDNGSSTGKLREEFNIPAVGDIRKVITSLSDIDPNIKKMLEYRFKTTSDLNGHALGNLILTAMLDITGSLEKSIKHLTTLLDVRHKVLPISEDKNLTLMVKTKEGNIIEGEEEITLSTETVEKIFYKKEPNVTKDVIISIKEADLIILSMGSLYTSLLPNIICKKVKETIKKTNSKIMYICNAVTQPGETDDFKVGDHIDLINKYLEYRKIDVVIASNSNIDDETAKIYETKEQKSPVIIDHARLNSLGVELIEKDLINTEQNIIRHDGMKLASTIMSYLMED